MGSDRFYPEERPLRRAAVAGFWIDETPVTNDEFAEFVRRTGYLTLAERKPSRRDYPDAPSRLLRAGSFVFSPPARAPALRDESDNPSWWRFVVGACWKRPLGPGSSLGGLGHHPVVHVVAEDAEAFAAFAGKALPTEAEWEFAARGGRDGRTDYAWGDELEPEGRPMAKVWQGAFPHRNLAPEALQRTAPVKSFPPNDFGLFDLIGNVWEWTADSFDAPPAPGPKPCCSPPRDGAAATIPRRVLKGGSHLCAPEYCRRYRPPARWPQPIDTSTSHIGFRCIRRGSGPQPAAGSPPRVVVQVRRDAHGG
jgi:formylglycine-generating enzyme required for sulfatase activity